MDEEDEEISKKRCLMLQIVVYISSKKGSCWLASSFSFLLELLRQAGRLRSDASPVHPPFFLLAGRKMDKKSKKGT